MWIVYRWIASDDDRAKLQHLRQESHTLRDAVLIGGVTCMLAATALFLRPTGLAGVPESALGVAGRVERRGFDRGAAPVPNSDRLRTTDCLVWSGGSDYGAAPLDGVAALLSVWAIGALIIALLQPGRQVFDLTLVLTPLALLGGMLVDRCGTRSGSAWLVARGRVVLDHGCGRAGLCSDQWQPDGDGRGPVESRF